MQPKLLKKFLLVAEVHDHEIVGNQEFCYTLRLWL